MNKALEYTLMGLGGLVFISVVAVFFLSPLVALVWVVCKYLIPQWTSLHTFGALMMVGFLGWGYILSKMMDK